MRRVAVEVAVALLLPVLLWVGLAWPLVVDPAHHVLSPMDFAPSDQSGEAWFHWWVHKASLTGAAIDHPGVVCVPGGVKLDAGFSNTVDAWLAWPAYHFLPFPQSYSAAGALVQLVTAWAAWLGLRAAGARPSVAIAGSIVLGLSCYTQQEVGLGHSANALIGPAILLLGAWTAVGEGRLGWAPVAMLAGAATVRAYPPFAVALAVPMAVLGLVALVRGPARGRAFVGHLGTGLVLLAVAAYTAKELAARGVGGAVVLKGQQLYPGYDADALPWNWPFFQSTFFHAHPHWMSAVLPLTAILWALRARRGLLWVAFAVWFWFVTLGVTLTQGDDTAHVRTALFGGRRILLASHLVLDRFPQLAVARPYRVAAFVPVALVYALGVLGQSRKAQVVASAALVAAFVHGAARGFLSPFAAPYQPSTALAWLAQQPAELAVAEVPTGRGHASGWAQVVHGHPRSESFRDMADPSLQSSSAPPECYKTRFTRTLWAFDRGAATAEDVAALRSEARDEGFGWLIVYPHAPDPLPGRGLSVNVTLPQLRAVLGDPVAEDDTAVIFAL